MSGSLNSSHVLIEPPRGWVYLNLKELWGYRELLFFLAWRDILAQYKQTIFGITWALFKPISQALVFTLVFGKVAKLSSSGLPYPLFTFCGIVAWGFFATTLNSSTSSVLMNTNLITKVYFPRLIIPVSAVGRGAVDFIISLIILAIMMFVYRAYAGVLLFFFPLFVILGIALTLGIGFIFSAISVKYRDLAQALPFIVQLWFWVTPVAYGIENIPPKLVWAFHLNPMTWIIQGFRWSLLGVGEVEWYRLLMTAFFSVGVFLGGLFYFRRTESEFADII